MLPQINLSDSKMTSQIFFKIKLKKLKNKKKKKKHSRRKHLIVLANEKFGLTQFQQLNFAARQIFYEVGKTRSIDFQTISQQFFETSWGYVARITVPLVV